MFRLSNIIYGAVVGVSVFLCVLLYKDVVRGREYIISEETARTLEKSRFISQSVTTKIVALQYILRDIHGRLEGEDLVYPDPSVLQYQNVTALLQAKSRTLPGNLLEGLAVFNNWCVYTSGYGADVVGRPSNHPICKLDKVDPNRFYIQYIPSEKSLSHRAVLMIALPFVGKDGQMEGGVTAIMNLSSAQDIINQIDTKQTDVMVIMDDQDHVLASRPIYFGGFSSSFFQPSNLHDLQETDSHITAARAIKTQDFIYSVQAVLGTPIYIVVGFEISEILTEWNRRAFQLTIGMIIIISLSFVLASSFINLRHQRDEMTRLASTDPLTGVANRRRFMQALEEDHARALSDGTALSLLLIDIDYFKRINDAWGHPTGDRVIKAISQILAQQVQGMGHVGRLGGEEFGVVLPHKGEIFATHFAEELCLLVAQNTSVFNDHGDRLRFQISIGIATVLSTTSSKEDLLSRADKALYDAKRNGRNQVAVASPPLQPEQGSGLKGLRKQALAS